MFDRILATLKVLFTGRNIVIGAMLWMLYEGATAVLGLAASIPTLGG